MKATATVKKWASQASHKFVVTYRQGGKRQARYFKDEKAAKFFAQEKTTELRNVGRHDRELMYDERQAVLVARQLGVNLRAAVDHYHAHVQALNHSATIEAAAAEFLSIRQAEGKAKATMADFRQRLGRFVLEFQ